jgi:hypothetical protein
MVQRGVNSMKCFVIGPIGEAGSAIRAAADDFMEYIVSPVVSQKEFEYDAPIRADSMNEPGRITSQIIKLLMDADLVIADLTGNNPNVYYELCLRHALGKPVIHMASDGTKLSFDVQDNRTIFYTMHSRVAEGARAELENQIRHIRQPDYKAMNPILETVGIINLERSADPGQAALGKLMGMVERLSGDIHDMQQTARKNSVGFPLTVGLLNSLGNTPLPDGSLADLARALGSKTIDRDALRAAVVERLQRKPDKQPS